MLALANAMCGTRRLNWRQAFAYPRALAFLPLLLSATGCVAAAAGAGAAVVFGGAAALTSTCYDRVSLRLSDAASGQVTCGARVSAVDAGGSEVVFKSCYHAAVPRGTWTVRAEVPGYATAKTPLIVPEGSRCDPAVQTIELTIAPVGYQSAAPPAPPAPPAPSARPAIPAAPSAAPSVAPPVPSSAAPPASAVPSASTPPAPAPPPAPAAAPTGAFPMPPAP
jgi:hypothetical protein